MSTAISGSAQIYQFPVGGRAGLRARHQVEERAPVLAKVAVGSGWYHDEAIREEDRRRGH